MRARQNESPADKSELNKSAIQTIGERWQKWLPVSLQILALVLAIAGFFYTVKPAFDRDSLKREIESLSLQKNSILEASVTLFALARLREEEGTIDVDSDNPFQKQPLDTSPEFLFKSWGSSPKEMVLGVLETLRSHELRELFPKLSQDDIDNQISALRKRTKESAMSFKCEFDPRRWSQQFDLSRTEITFDVASCVDTRMGGYIKSNGLSFTDVQLLRSHGGIWKRMQEDFEEACSDGRLQSLRLRYFKSWYAAKAGCWGRLAYVEKAILAQDIPQDVSPFLALPPGYSESERHRSDELPYIVADRIKKFGKFSARWRP